MSTDDIMTNKQGEAGEVYGNPEELAEEAEARKREMEEAAMQEAAKKLKEEQKIEAEQAIDNKDLGIFGK